MTTPDSDPPAIAYVVSRWGEPTQTFVRREAAAVKAAGCQVRALSLKRPAEAQGGTSDVHWLSPLAVLVGAAKTIAARPGASLAVIGTVVRRSAARNLPSQLVAALIGLAWAGHGLVRGRHLHAHFGWVAATAAWAAAEASARPYSVVVHAFDIHDRRRVDRFTPVPLRGATQTFTISHRDREIVRQQWGIEPAVLRMGAPASWLETGDGQRDQWLIVTVGSLLPKKGHAVLLDAVACADRRWQLVIIGEGSLRPQLEGRIDRLDLADRVKLLGSQSPQAVRAWLQRASASCLASVETPDGDRDGIPVALMEAMACGAVAIGTDVGAVPELLHDAGLIVPPGDAGALAQALDGLRDSDYRRSLAEAGRSRILREFVAEQAAAPVLRLIGIAAPTPPEVSATRGGHGR